MKKRTPGYVQRSGPAVTTLQTTTTTNVPQYPMQPQGGYQPGGSYPPAGQVHYPPPGKISMKYNNNNNQFNIPIIALKLNYMRSQQNINNIDQCIQLH